MYIIEGNIGAGKTTFLKLIAQNFTDATIIDEPLKAWDKKGQSQSLLTQFYKDTPRWAFTMEMFTLVCRIQEHMREQQRNQTQIVMERSIYSGYYCFALNSYKQGFMNDLEWEILKRWFTYLVKDKCANPNGFLYLKLSPEIAYDRTKKRNRSGEENIPLSYFKQIDEAMDTFLIKKQGLLPDLAQVPVLILDCDKDFVQNKQKQKDMLDQVKQFFAQTKNLRPTIQIKQLRT